MPRYIFDQEAMQKLIECFGHGAELRLLHNFNSYVDARVASDDRYALLQSHIRGFLPHADERPQS